MRYIQMGQTSVPLSKWVQPLVKPPVYQPTATSDEEDEYLVTMGSLLHNFHPDLGMTQVLCH